MSRVLAVIPARYGSSRFPGKLLADLGGAPLVVRVAECAARMRRVDQVVVATDDERIQEVVTAAGFRSELTGDHPTGTDRIGEVVDRIPADIVLNLQGDEPLLSPADGDRLIDALTAQTPDGTDCQLATLAHALDDAHQWQDPHVVKVLVDRAGFALYFSRAAVPGSFPGGSKVDQDSGASLAWRHIGVYAFRVDALRRYLALPRSPLEMAEGLEQLRALENGMRIRVVITEERPIGVDTTADLAEVRRRWSVERA
jgi:3-deoxy-manno-octulosonate cytidylyltransferase (CMP-KDO synthetase)